MISVAEYAELKKAVEDAKTKSDRAEGAFSQALSELKKDFGVAGVEEAKALLSELEEREKRLEAKLQKELAKFEEEFGDVLGR